MRNYLDLGRKILKEGEKVSDRTGTGIISLFGEQLKFDLREGLPILTSKKINTKPLIEELLWFLRGETNINTLNSNIWSAWSDEKGDLGPIYGKQWRDCDGIDQITEALRLIKEDPNSRRIIIDSWNVKDLPLMALSPCHVLVQFRVYNKHLDMQLYQRSADYALGVPFNITSYAILLSLFANECGLIPRYFIHTFGDVHIYLNHIQQFEAQLEKPIHKLPTLSLPSSKKVLDIRFDDIQILGYSSEHFLKYEVSV